MNVLRRAACVALAVLAATCGGSRPAPPSSGQPPVTSGGPISITGNERLGWTQTGDGADSLVYAAYVDGVRNQLLAACTASAPALYACQSPLPPMAAGTHTLQLSAAVRSGESLIEGSRSDSIVVTMTGSGTSRLATVPPEVAPAQPAPETTPTAEAAPSCGLATSDETHLIAWTSAGELQLIDVARRAAQPLTWSNETDATWRVTALASRLEGPSRFVYAALTSLIDSEPRLRVLRYRELNGVLGERAVLAEGGLPSEPAGATASFGPDGRVFVAFAWGASSIAPRPFVVAADPRMPAPLEFDPRFTARAAVTATWDRDGRLWIVERSDRGYTIRAEDVKGTPFAASSALVGIEGLTSMGAAPIALFAADGSGWLVTTIGSGAAAGLEGVQFLGHASFDALSLLGASVVGCHLGPPLTLEYGPAPRRRSPGDEQPPGEPGLTTLSKWPVSVVASGSK